MLLTTLQASGYSAEMRRSKQLSLFKSPRKNTKLWWIHARTNYGGSLDYRKVPRPLDPKKLTHGVFKARLGKSVWFTRFRTTIDKVVRESGRRYGVRIKDIAVNRDHIHILFWSGTREGQVRFLRLVASDLGRRYRGLGGRGQLWIKRPFTRLVSWGRSSLVRLVAYFRRNRKEAMGFISYRPRTSRLDVFLLKWKTSVSDTC